MASSFENRRFAGDLPRGFRQTKQGVFTNLDERDRIIPSSQPTLDERISANIRNRRKVEDENSRAKEKDAASVFKLQQKFQKEGFPRSKWAARIKEARTEAGKRDPNSEMSKSAFNAKIKRFDREENRLNGMIKKPDTVTAKTFSAKQRLNLEQEQIVLRDQLATMEGDTNDGGLLEKAKEFLVGGDRSAKDDADINFLKEQIAANDRALGNEVQGLDPSEVPAFQTPEDVKAAFQSGEISREEARQAIGSFR